jgi:hypothetical protein
MKRKATSAAAILSLALAIGSSTSAFRLIDALLLRPLRVANPERLCDLDRRGIKNDGKPPACHKMGLVTRLRRKRADVGERSKNLPRDIFAVIPTAPVTKIPA